KPSSSRAPAVNNFAAQPKTLVNNLAPADPRSGADDAPARSRSSPHHPARVSWRSPAEPAVLVSRSESARRASAPPKKARSATLRSPGGQNIAPRVPPYRFDPKQAGGQA